MNPVMQLAGRRIVLGVSGGIAAYKAAELTRLFVKAGADVRVIMTRAAEAFITPLTFESLSNHAVIDALFEPARAPAEGPKPIEHIEVADWADLLVIAPATAHVMARLAHGMADDVLATVALACKAPLLIAPAMNVNMWQHPATVANLATLQSRGVHTVGPDPGDLACGWVGQGRMAEPADIFAAATTCLAPRELAGQRWLVTAGPTYEPIDPVRFIGNRSTGKMGFAVAVEAAARGAQVTLVAGPTALGTPHGVTRVDVTTAAEMHAAVLARCEGASTIVMAAAVADERPSSVSAQKLKKNGQPSTLALEATVDILAELGARIWHGTRPTLVGFAAETEAMLVHAQHKLEKKGCDLLVANDVSASDAGFATDDNRVTLLRRGGAPEQVPLASKRQIAARIVDAVKGLRR